MNNIVEELTLQNFLSLQKKIDEIDNTYYISTLNFLTWSFYDIKIYFKILDDVVYLYSYKENKHLFIHRPIFKKNQKDLIKKFYKQAIVNVKDVVINCEYIQFASKESDDIKLFKNAEFISKFNTLYLYETDKLKFMNGKKMQKKRNFLNSFKKNFEANSKVVKYEDKYFNDVYEFCLKHSIDVETNEVRKSEMEALKFLLKMQFENGSGTILYYDNQMIGFTYGLTINENKYEIFIEKADEAFRGSYQYLLSTNLNLNNINTTFIDRQDDMGIESLEKSKKSYNPCYIWESYFFKVKNIAN